MAGVLLRVSAAGRERVLIKEPLHTGLMQPDSLIFLSAGISGCYRPSSRRPGPTWGTSFRTFLGSFMLPEKSSLRCGPRRACAGCLSRSGPPTRFSPSGRRKSWHGIVLPPRRQPASSPRFPPPLRRASPLTGLLPPPLLHLFSLFSPLTRTLPPAEAPSPAAHHGKTH